MKKLLFVGALGLACSSQPPSHKYVEYDGLCFLLYRGEDYSGMARVPCSKTGFEAPEKEDKPKKPEKKEEPKKTDQTGEAKKPEKKAEPKKKRRKRKKKNKKRDKQ